jgi:hypothetical protein
MPVKPSTDDLDRLVLSDADFGKAYLTEAWAARFMTTLFREHTLCFVGYSIDDPVLRYMTAAHALSDGAREIYAFAAHPDGKETDQYRAWMDKNVTPVLYNDKDNHRNLHRTLQVWASIFQDGTRGLERVVSRLAHRPLNESMGDNHFVGRMLWALAHPSGLPAKRFAEFNPVPPLDWLDALSEERFRHTDLDRFGVPSLTEINEELTFSLIRRPAPYLLAPRVALVSGGTEEGGWDAVMFYLAHWLKRHLNDPKLIHWLAERGGQLHPRWALFIEQELDHFARLERDGDTTKLNEIRTNAPNAIPGPILRPLWRVFLTGRVKSFRDEIGLYRWKDRFRREGLSATLRLELRELLAPKVALKRPFRWGQDDSLNGTGIRLQHLVDWELVLASGHVHTALRDLADDHWQKSLPALLDDFQQLLRDALDLLGELGEAGDRNDRSNWDLPSITPHQQNRGFRDWVALIELLRDSWLAVRGNDPARGTRIAQAWFDLPYATFKRLALFAASQEGCITPEQWVGWLLADDGWWLWTVVTKRETMRLLVLQGHHLSPLEQARLEVAILAGPPRKMYPEVLEILSWESVVERSVWLHLSKLKSSGINLGTLASEQLKILLEAHSEWRLAANDSDEFSSWMSATGDPDYEDHRKIDIAPSKRMHLIQWLQQPPAEPHPLSVDTWWKTCKKHPANTGSALSDLASQGIWPASRWRDAFNAWSEKDQRCRRTWRCFAPVVRHIPDSVLQQISDAVTWWLECAAKTIDRHETILLDLCRRVLEQPLESGTSILKNGKPLDEPVSAAINHPVGHATQALLNYWFKGRPNDNDHLPADLELVFTLLCDTQVERFRHGRVLLAANMTALFRVDRNWTEAHLLPLFDWASDPIEAKALWEGFLWSPNLYPPLLIMLKSQFLETSLHYEEIVEHHRNFAGLLTFTALESVDTFTPQELQTAIGLLPQEGLREVAGALLQALEAAGEQREDYWENRIRPFWQHIWPKSRNLASEEVAESLARLCLAAGTEFPSALTTVQDWVQPIKHPYYVVDQLDESGLCMTFPAEALRLLAAIIKDQPWEPEELGKCLGAISQADPSLLQNVEYRRLDAYHRQRSS